MKNQQAYRVIATGYACLSIKEILEKCITLQMYSQNFYFARVFLNI